MQNLREEVAMDVDEDEEGSQHAKRIPDYGIEVDFSALDDDEREVCLLAEFSRTETDRFCRTVRPKR